MNNVSQPKVFEFAKEIGMETLALMDKIREWKLPVRSHMAELDSDTLEQIRSRLLAEESEKSGSKKKTAKKKVAKKATAEKPAAKATAAPKASAAKKTTAKKATAAGNGEAVKAAPTNDAATTGGKKVVVKKAPSKTLVRRKPSEEEAAQAEAEAETAVSTEDVASSVAAQPESHVEPEITSAPAVVEEEVVAAAPVAEESPRAVLEVAAAPVEGASTETPSTSPVARKREVVMTRSGPVSGVRSEAPRRNIIGRMDLSRVSAPQGARPAPGGGSAPGGPRPIMQRNLRPGFVPAATTTPAEPGEDLADRRKFDDKKRRGGPGGAVGGLGAGPGGTTTKEKEAEVVAFTATEFRKREMVFQPKKKKGSLSREAKKTEITTPKAHKRVVKVDKVMKVGDLAQEMGVKASQIVKTLMQQGMMATMATDLDFDTIALISPEFGFEAQNVHQSVDQMIESTAFGDLAAEPTLRAPVVTIMGHVDHGKTSLLDSIRNARVAAGEAGGITQHIGAYRVKTESGHDVTFIDTPGHEAFTAMRARGANVTDIVVIVVAADDGVMPQTIEAINHAKAAEVPIIVAMNKIDKPGANPDRIKQQMTEYELIPEEWGGQTIFVGTSALKKTGINELLEQIYLVAEVEELKANPERSATGIVIESRMDKGRGAVATLLVQDGTLKTGQSVVVGTVPGRVRSLINDRGERVNEAGPSVPVEILGLPEVPAAGDKFDVCVDDDAAQKIAGVRKAQFAEANRVSNKVSLEDLFSKFKQGDLKELPIVLKSDVAGSAEAIKAMFEKLGTSEVKVKVIHSAIGGINESDILLASTAKGIVVGFNVRPDGSAQAMAKREGVEIKTYTIVYELMDDMKKAMAGLLAPTIVETQLGRAEVRNTFSVPKMGTIAGCYVVDGKILRSAQVRLVRDGKIVYTGKIGSLKRFKDDAREVAAGFECGLGIENFNDIKVGDVIEAFSVESVNREL